MPRTLSALLLALGTTGVALGQDNLLVNGSFDLGFEGWTVTVTKKARMVLGCGEEGLAPLEEGEGVLRQVRTSCVLSQQA